MKQPNWKTPFILSASLFVLGSFTYWLQFSHKPKRERSDAQLKKPLPIAEDRQIRSIRLQSAGAGIVLECTSLEAKTCKPGMTGNWKITTPVNLPADPDNVRDLISNLNSMSATETIDLTEESSEKRSRLLEEYGLGEARRNGKGTEFVEATLDDGSQLTAWFGEPHPVGDKQFVGSALNGKLQTSTVFLLGNFYKNNVIGKSVSWFRDKKLFSFKREEIESFNLEGSSGRVSALKKNGAWMVNGLEGDYERIETLLASAAQARAKDFPEGGTPPGLRRKLRLTWHTSSGDQSLEILSSSQKNKEAPRLYLKSPLLKEVVEIESNLNVQLDRTATYLRRNLLITQAEKINITTASLEGKAYSQTIRFSFDGKNWTQTAGDPKLNPEKVRELLTALSEGHSPELVAPAPREESPPVTLTLGDSKQPARFVFKVYPAKGKNWARIAGSPRNEAFELEARAGKAFPFQPDSWKLK